MNSDGNESRRTRLSVCTQCTDTSHHGEEGIGGGTRLLTLFRNELDSRAQGETIELQTCHCLMGCTEGCLVAVAAPGKMQYLIGRLPAETAPAAIVVDFALMYAQSPTGIVPNHLWPGDLAMHFLGRIPPLQPNPDGNWNEDGCDL